MKRERGIRWKESIGNNDYRENVTELILSIGSDVLLSVVCTLLFVLSTRIMFNDVYKYCGFGAGNVLLIMLITFMICGAMELASRTAAKWGGIVQCGVLGVGILFCVIYLSVGDNAKEILSGLEKTLSFYVDHWNLYYKTSAGGFVGDLRYVEKALDFLTVIIYMTLIWIARIVESNMVMVIPPVLVLFLELMVGRSPKALGLFMMIAGCLLANASVWHMPGFKTAPGKKKALGWLNRYISWISVGLCTLIMCLIVNFAGASSAEGLINKSDKFRAWIDEVVNDITGASIWDLFDGEGIFGNNDDTNTETLTNNSPKFKYKEFMKLALTFEPNANIYLRGFYGDIYDKGVWERDEDAFVEACEDAGYDSDVVSREILTLGISKLMDVSDVDSLSELITGKFAKISYVDSSGRRCYAPYFSEITQKGISIEGDGRYVKKKNTEDVYFYMWSEDGLYQSYLYSLSYGDEREWEEWYESYVMENYLDVTPRAPYVSDVANEIKLWENSEFSVYDGNMERLHLAELVAVWMEQNTQYSLNPPELPGNVDPIEYFLKNSKTGYCMHYASASVMILRQLGVPARYASGYLVAESDFSRTQSINLGDSNGVYAATVLDSQAHAWVEIYLDGIGWVPVEVTKGYNPAAMGYEQPTTNPADRESTSNNEPATEDEPTTEALSTAGNNQPTSTQAVTSTNAGKQTGADGDNNGASGGLSGINVKLILIIMVLAISVPLIIYGIRRLRANYRYKLERQMNKNRIARSIKLMNRRIYRKLRYTGKIFKPNLSDETYLDVLIKTYPDISEAELERFMDIVKAVTFSHGEFTVEEMEFCYGIYNRIIKNS